MLQDELIESEGKRGHVENLFSELAKEAEELEMKLKQYEMNEATNELTLEVEGLGKALRAYEILLDEIVRKLKSSSLPLELFVDNEDIEVPLLDNFDDNDRREEFLRKLCILEQCLKNLVEYSESFNNERDVWRDKIKVFEEEMGAIERNNEKLERELQIEVESKSQLRKKLNEKLDKRCNSNFNEKEQSPQGYLENNDDISKLEKAFRDNQRFLIDVVKTLMMALISNDRLEELQGLNSKYFEQKIESMRQEKSLQKNECVASTISDDKDRRLFYKEISMQKDDLKKSQNQIDFLDRRQKVLLNELKAQIDIENEEVEKLKQGIDDHLNNNMTTDNLNTDENGEEGEYPNQNDRNMQDQNQQYYYQDENTDGSNDLEQYQYHTEYNSQLSQHQINRNANNSKPINYDRGLQSSGRKNQMKIQYVATNLDSKIKDMMKEDQDQIKNVLTKIKNKVYHM